MKKQIRVIGIDDSPFNKFKDKKVLVIGTIYRGGDFIDGLISCFVDKDGEDATDKLIQMINSCKFKPQLQYIFLDGIAVAGFNVIDVKKLSQKTKLPVIVVIRNYPNFEKIKTTLKRLGMKEKIKLIDKAGPVTKVNNIFVQLTDIDAEKAKQLLKITCTHSYIPEPLRVAHIIGSGIVKGESRGKA